MAKSKLTTIFMLDVVGSMALWEANRDSASRAIERLEEIVAECAARHSGTIVKKRGEGDSFFLTFESPGEAILAAADLHRRLLVERWPTPSRLQVRGAIRTGECEVRDGDLFGPTVNRCARMRAAAHADQIVACEATHALLASARLDHVLWVDLGSYRLRDAAESEAFFGLAIDGETPVATSLALEENAFQNLPIRATSFVGREAELEMVETSVRQNRLTTLTGPGGSGKTRLSEEAADRFVGEFVDGVWFVSLADCATADLAATGIARAIPSLTSSEANWDSTLAALRSKRALILLDNCEHLIPKLTAFVNRLIHECPGVRILATSRKPFNLNEESVVPVQPFSVDGLDESSGELEAKPAFALFWQRAKAKNPTLKLDSPSAQAVVAICRQLSGIPLAIEQAASYAGRLSLMQIEERLRGKVGMLKSAPGTVEARHETMRATIEWSIGLLSPEARNLVHQLAVFSGGWSLEAAEAICSDQIDAFEAHGELTDSSLIYWTDDDATGRRFRFLEPIREFVVEADSISSETRSHFLDWILGFAERVDMEMVGGNQAEWIRRAESELENFRSALNAMWSVRDDRLPRLANYLKRLWLRLGLYREGASWLENALSVESSSEPRLRATLLNALGACRWRVGDWERAEASYNESLKIWEAIGDKSQIGAVNTNLAICATSRGFTGAAIRYYERSCSAFETAGDRRGLGSALMNLGYLETVAGRHAPAQLHLAEAIDHLRHSKHVLHLGYALGNLATVELRRGDLGKFSELASECVQILEESHDMHGHYRLLVEFGSCAMQSNLPALARMCLAAADQIANESRIDADQFIRERVDPVKKWLEGAASMEFPRASDSIHDFLQFAIKSLTTGIDPVMIS